MTNGRGDGSPARDLLVEVRNLTKHFGAIRAVDGISFEVRRGDVLAFLGPNGAGKTTAMQMITGFLEPDAGEIRVAGHAIDERPIEARRRLGYLPENAPAYGEMSVTGFLEFVAEAREVSNAPVAIARTIARTGLGEVAEQTIETLSKGFKRRVGLAQALIHDPEVLILDEPTDGLDPNQKAIVQELIESLSAERAIIVSTHILDEAEKVCNRAVVLSQGKILVDSTPQELMRRAPGHDVIEVAVARDAVEALIERCRTASWCGGAEPIGDGWVRIRAVEGRPELAQVIELVGAEALVDLRAREGRLEDFFREITRGVAA